MKRPLPKLKSRKSFAKFVENHDLGDYLEIKDLKPVHMRLKSQDRTISLRISSSLLDLLKKAADKHQVKYQRLIKSILEENIGHYVRP